MRPRRQRYSRSRAPFRTLESLEERTLLSTLVPIQREGLPLPFYYKSILYDHTRERVYVSFWNSIYRYDLATRQLLPTLDNTLMFGGSPGDITPDGSSLYFHAGSNLRDFTVVRKVDPETGTFVDYQTPLNSDENCGLDLRIASDGYALLTNNGISSGSSVRRMNLASGQVSFLYSTPARQVRLARSADRSFISLVGRNDDASSGVDYAYESGTKRGGLRPAITPSGNLAVNADGALHAFETAAGIVVEDRQFAQLVTLPGINGGVAFDPVRPILYVSNPDTDEIVAFSTASWSPLFRLPIGEDIDGVLNRTGQMVVSSDGAHLVLVTYAGIRHFNLASGVDAALLPQGAAPQWSSPFAFSLDAVRTDATYYVGTVRFLSSDPLAQLPADYTFTADDAGTHAFSYLPGTPGAFTLQAVDLATGAVLAAYAGTAAPRTVPFFLQPVTSGTCPTLSARFDLAGIPPDVLPTGTVRFETLQGSATVVIGTSPLVNGACTLDTSALQGGAYEIRAVYEGDARFAPATTGYSPLAFKRAVHLTLAALGPDRLSMSVNDHLPAAQFRLVDTSTGATLWTGGNWYASQFWLGQLPAGPYTLALHFDGDATHEPAASAPLAVTAPKRASTLTLYRPYHDTLAVALNSTDSFPFAGKIDIYDMGTLLKSVQVTDRSFSFLMDLLPVGSHSLTAVYSGDFNHHAVSSPPLVETVRVSQSYLWLRATATLLPAGKGLTLTASVYPLAAGTVTFYDGPTPLAAFPVSGPEYTFTVPAVSAGRHEYRAVYTLAGSPVTSAAAVSVHAAPFTVIDLLAVYTSETLAAAGSLEALHDFVRAEIRDANTVFINSDVPIHLRLVSLSFIPYRHSSSFQTDLTRLANPADGYLDAAIALRNALGADLVALINPRPAAEPADPTFIVAGIARSFGDAASVDPDRNAFLVINQHSRNQYLLAHEVGHTLGAGHVSGDRTDVASADYGHGYRFTANGTLYRDIMAYDPGQRIPHFANPAVYYQGQPTGNPHTADIARLFRELGPVVANYRHAAVVSSLESRGATLAGWALDPRVLDTSLDLRLEENGVSLITSTANLTRPDLLAAFGSAAHGFSIPLPRLPEGVHTLHLYATDAVGSSKLVAIVHHTAPPALFDESWYLARNPDAQDAWAHFLSVGQFAGRDPSPYFDTAFYLAQNPDVAAAWLNHQLASPFVHYLAAGQFEARRASPYFDERFYRLANPDVAAAIGTGSLRTGLQHFLLRGQFEGRSPLPYFDPAAYTQSLTSLGLAAPASPYADFLLGGNAAGHNPSPWFDAALYLNAAPDVAAAVSARRFPSAFDHFLRAGLREGRTYSARYAEPAYLAANPDVAAAVTKGLFASGFEHYLLAGRFENRRLALTA